MNQFVRLYGILFGTIEYFWVLLGTIGYYWVLLGTIGYFWVLLDTTGYYSVLVSWKLSLAQLSPSLFIVLSNKTTLVWFSGSKN